MEIAKLEAILTGDVKPLQAALTTAKTSIDQFASEGADAFLTLNAGLSKTAQTAISAGNDIRSLTAALDVLQSEQSGIVRGTTLWQLYETEIKKVNAQLDIMEAQLPVITAETKVLGATASSSSGLGGIGKGLTGAFSGLRQIAYILPGIGLAGLFNLAFEAISAAAEELDLFNSQMKELAEAQDKVAADVAKEANQVTILVGELQKENLSRQEKVKAIKELQSIAPAYFSNLKLEGDTVINLTDDYANFGRAIIQVAKIKAASDLNQENVTKQIQLQLQTSRDLQELYADRSKFDDNHLAFVTRESFILERQLEGQTKLTQAAKPLLDIITQAERELNALGGNPFTKPIVEDLKKIKETIEHIKPEKFIEAFIPWAISIKAANEELAKTPALLGQLKPPVILSDEEIKALEAKINGLVDITKGVADAISSSLIKGFSGIGEALGGQGDIFGSFRDLIGDGLKAIGEDLIKIGTLALIAKLALEDLFANPIAAIAAGIALVALGSAISSQHKGIQGHAEGGIFAQPTLVGNQLFGESGTEVLLPLDRLQSMIGGMNNTQNVVVTGRISGNDIVLIQNRQNTRNNRNYGGNFSN